METVKEWVFSPAIKNGLPVATVVHAPIGFRIFDKPTDPSAKPPSPSPAPINETGGDPQPPAR